MKKIFTYSLSFFLLASVFTSKAQVAFSEDNNNQCVPMAVNFTNFTHNSTDTTKMTFKWYFGDGDSADTYNASHTFTTAGNYNVVLVAYDSLGAYVNQSSNILNALGVRPFFPSDSSKTCPNEQLTFNTNDSWNSIKWYFGDGDSATNNWAQHTYTSLGNYTVTLILDHPSCGVDTVYQTIIVDNSVQPVIYSINSNASQACPNDGFTFYGNYPTNYSSYYWSFGDGDTSIQQNPTHAYADTGSYQVIHRVTNACGNMAYDTMYVSVRDTLQPDANFNIGNNFSCPYSNYFFSPNFVGYSSYEWDFGDGYTSTMASPQHAYSSVGNYSVTLIVTNSCGNKDTAYGNAQVQYNVFNTPFASIRFEQVNWSADTIWVCPTETFRLRNYSWANNNYASYLWDFDDGSTTDSVDVSHSYTTPGTYEISMTITNGCNAKDSTFKYVVVDNSLTPDVDLNNFPFDSACPGAYAYFWDENFEESRGYTYSYWFGDGDSLVNITEKDTTVEVLAIHQYPTTPGVYNWTVSVTNLCGNDTLVYGSITIDSNVTNSVYFVGNSTNDGGGGPNPRCPNEIIEFYAVGGSTYFWNFGDGDTASGQFVYHAYSSAATYTASVIIVNGCGKTDTMTSVAYIDNTLFPNSWYSMSSTFACGYDTINFTYDNYNWIDTSSYSFIWVFGDGDTSYVLNPSHVYNQAGTFQTELYVTNGCGNTSSNFRSITIDIPIVSFSGIDSVFCANGGKDTLMGLPYGGVFAGAGVSDSLFDPSVAGAGTHGLTYTYTNGNGCSETAYDTTIVNAIPVVDAGNTATICNGFSTTLSATGGPDYAWTPASSLSSASIANPIASPTVTTTYSLVVTNADGCSDEDTVTVNVAASLTANAGPDTALCIGSSVTLNGSGGSTYSWTPSTGLSNTSISNPVANPTVTTSYILTVASGTCNDVDTVTVTVNNLPTVSVTGSNDSICNGNSATLSASGAQDYGWTPATGLSATTGTSISAGPTSNTTYTITGTDANGCVDTDVYSVTVIDFPTVDAGTGTTICSGDTAQLNSTHNGTAASVSWSPSGSLSSSTTDDPSAFPTSTTTYTLSVANVLGCASTDTVTVFVNPLPTASAGADDSICTGSSVTLSASGGTAYSWSPGTGLSSSTIANPIASPSSTTNYTVTVTDNNSCSSTDEVLISILNLPTLSVTAGMDSICNGNSTNLSASGAQDYTWSPASGLSSSTGSNPTADPTVTTTYTVSGTDANGCMNSDTVALVVIDLPTVDAGTDVDICSGDTTQLNGTHNGVSSSVSWTPATGLSSTSIDNPMANPTSTTSYILSVENILGCSVSDSVTVTVNSLPSANAGADDSLCIGSSVNLGATGGSSYLWIPGASLDDDTLANPVATPTVSTAYMVTVTDTNGCSSMDTVLITVNPLPNADGGPSANVCTGGTAQFNASGGTQYAWTPATGLSNTAISNPIVTPTGSTTYTVTVTDGNGCVASDTVSVGIAASLTAEAGPNDTICLGEGATLTGTGGGSYAWSPSATLNDSTLSSPVATPTVTITYYLTVSSGSCSDMDSAIVFVNTPPTVTFSTTDTVCSTDPAFTLSGGSPAGGTYSGTGVSSGMFDPATAGVGSHTLTYTYTDPTTSCMDSATHVIIVDPCTGINSYSWAGRMSVYPNPTRDLITVEYNAVGFLVIEVIDMKGQLVMAKEINKGNTRIKETLDMSYLAKGVYSIRVRSEVNTSVKRIILN